MSNLSLEALAKKIQSIKDRFERLEKDVRGLKDLLNVHDNWHSTIRGWVGQLIAVCDRTGHVSEGKLNWSDRYNLCVELPADDKNPKPKTRVYTKGGINWIEKP
jgi:hypothetical protein